MEANFGKSKIDHCDFERAILRDAQFKEADLIQCVLRQTDLRALRDFREALPFRGGDFWKSTLAGARFGDAKFAMADLRGADLTGAREMTADQLSQSLTDQSTVLPNGSRGPFMRRSGAEKPKLS